MVSCERIVCCVDFSEFSAHALHYAAALARWYNARLTALHAVLDVPAVDVLPMQGGMPPLSLKAVDGGMIAESLRTFVSIRWLCQPGTSRTKSSCRPPRRPPT